MVTKVELDESRLGPCFVTLQRLQANQSPISLKKTSKKIEITKIARVEYLQDTWS